MNLRQFVLASLASTRKWVGFPKCRVTVQIDDGAPVSVSRRSGVPMIGAVAAALFVEASPSGSSADAVLVRVSVLLTAGRVAATWSDSRRDTRTPGATFMTPSDQLTTFPDMTQPGSSVHVVAVMRAGSSQRASSCTFVRCSCRACC